MTIYIWLSNYKKTKSIMLPHGGDYDANDGCPNLTMTLIITLSVYWF